MMAARGRAKLRTDLPFRAWQNDAQRDYVSLRQQWNIDGVPMELIRKNIRTLRIGVHAPDGRVSISAPLSLDERVVRGFVAARFEWIVRKRMQIRSSPQPHRLTVSSGESHFFAGRAHRIILTAAAQRPSVRLLPAQELEVSVREGMTPSQRKSLLQNWYREQLGTRLEALVDAWQLRIGVRVAEVRVRQMKTRWGSCNARARRIWLNLELMKAPPECLEYVVVHELVHLLERGHNARFRAFMDSFLPNWRELRRQLNRFAETA
jgi:predicted metal-dependent hydrolase